MKKASLLVFLFFLFSFSQDSFAYDGNAGDYVGGMGRKLGRGVWNVLSSPAEIPCTIRVETGEYGSGAWTGFGRGSWRFFQRFVVGATEIMTFVIPMEKTLMVSAVRVGLSLG